MGRHTKPLWELTGELFGPAELTALRSLAGTDPLDYKALSTFDEGIGGPSISRINAGRTGRYAGADRDVFRPIQYCAAYFYNASRGADAEWITREIVHVSSVHLESLVKQIGKLGRLPLGKALGELVIKRKLDTVVHGQIKCFNKIYNASKHDFDHPMDTHLFSVEDAILAYVVCRKIGTRLFPLASLVTDLRVFDRA